MAFRPGLTLLAAALAVWAAEPRILRPTNQTVVPEGKFTIIARGEPRVDGKAVPCAQPAPDVCAADVALTPGAHEIASGGETVKVHAGAGAPGGWKPYKPHPPAAACTTCHAVQAGAWELKGGAAGPNCLACHDAKTFPKAHQHNTEVLTDCQTCHDPHGSAAKFHLKLPKETACKQCHG